MKKKGLLIFVLLVGLAPVVFSQVDEVKYRRSSLTMMLIESDNFPNKEVVLKAYNEYPFPDKYNKHDIGSNSFDINSITLTEEDLIANNFLTDTLDNPIKIAKAQGLQRELKWLNEEKTKALALPYEMEEYRMKVDKYIKENQVAKKVIATWFNRQPDGTMDKKLVIERGMYSASEEDKDLASGTASAVDALYDEELIGNTFVIFNKLKFVENEPIARAMRDVAKAQAAAKFAGKPQALLDAANKAADEAYEKAKEGYSVWTTSFLYQLDYSAEIAEKIKSNLFNSNVDAKAAWDTCSFLNLKLVGEEKAQSLVTFKIGETRTEEQIITLATQRNIDNVFAKLQKKYVVFRPVSPIASVGPLAARIGLKEGLEAGQTFEILESQLDKKTYLPKYVSVGKIKVDKNFGVWDNRIGAKEEPILDAEGNPVVTPEFTTFTGGKKAVVGMHFIRLVK